MKKNKIAPDLAYTFWEKYEEADYLQRDKLILPIIKNFAPMIKIKEEKMRQHVLNMYLRSYFDDLIDYFYCKDNNKLKKK